LSSGERGKKKKEIFLETIQDRRKFGSEEKTKKSIPISIKNVMRTG